jgi:hypothetical protein
VDIIAHFFANVKKNTLISSSNAGREKREKERGESLRAFFEFHNASAWSLILGIFNFSVCQHLQI